MIAQRRSTNFYYVMMPSLIRSFEVPCCLVSDGITALWGATEPIFLAAIIVLVPGPDCPHEASKADSVLKRFDS